ncbi:MAG: bifunctional riboflavin kinase/FAD synthetase [Alphaproteobacteria bacterium]|nr:bifunctional riboflavin kinase/FAD synthetase [Alphaproteobacteria bacterium]
MHIHRYATSLPAAARGAVVAIGNFDGVHLGHQAVIGIAGRLAREHGAPPAVLSFEPHPRGVFQPDAEPFRLTPFRAKAELLRRLGVALLYSLRFDRALAARSAQSFVHDILHRGLGIRHAVVGYDFVFGNRRRGTAAMLRELGGELGFGVTIVDPVQTGDEVYSSTRIRDLLAEGDPRRAAAFLGRFWEIDGRVRQGDRRGRTIGFPTANLLLDGYLRPATGVYAVRAGLGRDGVWHDGVANFGLRPTVGGTELRLEAHLFDFTGDLYGRHLRVALVDYIRPERKFAGLDALKAQIAADCAQARTILAATPAV